MPMHHFSYGFITPTLAYAASYVGCLLGLMCAARARVLTGRARRGWLAAAAVSLGGTGIWVMHFIAMLGFSVGDVQIRYKMGLTVISALVAIVAVGAGLAVVGNDARKLHRIALAGLLAGIGIAGMHYLGMAAMVMPAAMTYEPILFSLSILIAVVAAAVALWFTLVINSRVATLAAAALMAVAVCGMHYTGMAAMRLSPDNSVDTTAGTSFDGLLLPVLLAISVITVVLLVFVSFSASPAELVEDAQFSARLENSLAGRERGQRGHGEVPPLRDLPGSPSPAGGARRRPAPTGTPPAVAPRTDSAPTIARKLNRPPANTRRR